jgi:hypothetical protein
MVHLPYPQISWETIFRFFTFFWKSTSKKISLLKKIFFLEKMHLWVCMTHKGDPNMGFIIIQYILMYVEDNLQVWALQSYNSTFYKRNCVKKCHFSS